jgi:BirA family biotin operon repressor/biotin-[acetyl-CoA-carboxylase] ligase
VTVQAAFWRLEVHEALGSTSDSCRQRGSAGEGEGLAVMVRVQTAGRGSRGRAWVSPPGNLYLSVLLRPATALREAGLWALLAGVAVAEALDEFGVVLKWPNDVMHRGAKLGGILVESQASSGEALDFMVIGIGLNLAHAPDLPDRRAASLDGAVTPDVAAAHVLARLNHWRAVQATDGWAPVRAAWLARALPLGAEMTLRQGETRHSGRFAGLAEDGSLLLDVDGSAKHFSSGEIWLIPDAAEAVPC